MSSQRPTRERLLALSIMGVGAALAGLLLFASITSPVDAVPRGTELATAADFQLPTGRNAEPKSGPSTLVLYQVGASEADTDLNYVAEIAATMMVNLLGHFGPVEYKEITEYQQGDGFDYALVAVVATSEGELIPTALLNDVGVGSSEFLWIGESVDQLAESDPNFANRFGWTPDFDRRSDTDRVLYKSTHLRRNPKADPFGTVRVVDADLSESYGKIKLGNDRSMPWAIRSDGLTYVSENPFKFHNPTDRGLILADLLIEILDPERQEQRQALVRIEDVGPWADPEDLRMIADALGDRQVPFSVAVYPLWADPHEGYNLGDGIRLADRPEVVDALLYMESRGGTLLMHGFTHQYEELVNPYGGVSGEDYEFFVAEIDKDDNVVVVSPVPDDSTEWMRNRVQQSFAEFEAAGLPEPTIFEFPHYAGSAVDYEAITDIFEARFEQGTYYWGQLTNSPTDYSRDGLTQGLAYPVFDIYGEYVIPENLGNIIPVGYNNNRPADASDLVRNAEDLLVVRDSVASFFFHSYLDVEVLTEVVDGIEGHGYTFVAPVDVLASWDP